MIDHIILFSIRNKLIIGLFVIGIMGWGIYSLQKIPMDAVPDITNNQVQIITQAPTLAAQEVERFITFPIENSVSNLPDVLEIRSVSRFGISAVTIVFEEEVDIYRARQMITEQLKHAEEEIPEGFGTPELGPVTTGLGEVYQYILYAEEGYESVFTPMELRTINDWYVKRQLAGTSGVIEISGWGGFLKQYEVALNPEKLKAQNVTISEVFHALEMNNENTGGSYIEKEYHTYFIRGEGMVSSLADIQKIVVKTVNEVPVLIRDVGEVHFGAAPRYGAVTWNGKEVVAGQALMLKGENSMEVVNAVKERIETIKKSLPEGVQLKAFIDRSELIDRAMSTVSENLIMGGLIVIFILVLLLGNFRGGLIVASTIPLSMLFALGLMNVFGVSANLMSLGALDFGIIVDGAVIIVESVVFYWGRNFASRESVTQQKMDEVARQASSKMMNSAFFGQLIILIVFLPLLTLQGIEGKMFRPMALTVTFAMLGAIVLSLTYIPVMSALFLKPGSAKQQAFSEKISNFLQRIFTPLIELAIRFRLLLLCGCVLLVLASGWVFSRLGGEFIPVLEEGDFAIHQILPPGSSLRQGVKISEKVQSVLLDNFVEVEDVVVKIGTAEIPTDPMPIEVGDVMVKMKPKEEWVNAQTKEEMFEKMKVALSVIPGLAFEFTQPIQMRFNEMMTGIREDVAVKIYGENLEILYETAKEAEQIIRQIPGAGDPNVEQVIGLPQMVVRYNRDRVAQYGLNISGLNKTLKTGFAGASAGVVFEDERKFDLVVRLQENRRGDLDDIRNLYVTLPNGGQIPLKEVASIEIEYGPMQISRENARRRIHVGINSEGRDVESLIQEIDEKLTANLTLPPGYWIEYGGAFENLESAKKRLLIVVPIALGLIFLLVFFALNSLKQSLIIFLAIPFAAVGGIWALWFRDMPFSISAGVGFIVLSGVAVLNALILIHSMEEIRKDEELTLEAGIVQGTLRRLRPILLTASTDILGFLPMALSHSGGAEVQRPLATVVIGGLVSATILTLFLLPALYSWVSADKEDSRKIPIVATCLLILFCFIPRNDLKAQAKDTLTLEEAVNWAMTHHPKAQEAYLKIQHSEALEKTAFQLDPLQINVSYGQMNSAIMDYSMGASQRFELPAVYASRKKTRSAQTEVSRAFAEVTCLDLEKEVRTRYYELVFATEKVKLLQEWEEVYDRFAEVAEKKYTVGESNMLEKTAAISRWEEVKLKVGAAQASVGQYQFLLESLLNREGPFEVMGFPATMPELDTVQMDHPLLEMRQKQLKVQENETLLAKKAFLPGFSVGYFNQQLDGIGGRQGVQVGTDIPLSFRANRANVRAANLGAEMATSRWQLEQMEFNQELNSLRLSYWTARNALEFYENQALKNADQLIRFARKSYESGEIGYMEFIQNMDMAFNIRFQYIEAKQQAHHQRIQLQFLTGNFNSFSPSK